MDSQARIGMSAQLLLRLGGWWFDSTWIRLHIKNEVLVTGKVNEVLMAYDGR